MKSERIQHRRMSQTGSLQLPMVVRLDVFENGQHVGAMHPAVLAVLLPGELVKVVDFLLDGGGNGADVEPSLALWLIPAGRSDEEVESVEVGEGTQRLEERHDVGLGERKRRVDGERGEIDPLRGRRNKKKTSSRISRRERMEAMRCDGSERIAAAKRVAKRE